MGLISKLLDQKQGLARLVEVCSAYLVSHPVERVNGTNPNNPSHGDEYTDEDKERPHMCALLFIERVLWVITRTIHVPDIGPSLIEQGVMERLCIL